MPHQSNTSLAHKLHLHHHLQWQLYFTQCYGSCKYSPNLVIMNIASFLRELICFLLFLVVFKQMNLPDIFDIYSAGLIFLQMAFPGLRTDGSLIQFNRQLKRCDYDLVAWRKSVEPRAGPELLRGFEMLDLYGGIGRKLLTSMVPNKARQRTSAKAALAHPYLDQEGLLALSFMQKLRLQLFRATQQDYGEAANWTIQLMAKSGTEKEGGFIVAQLQDLREREEPRGKASAQRNALASALRLQRKIIRTLNESMDELSRRSKSLWWSRWISREE
ncbi:hypothetical protein P3X46_031298 [Hevea brasiliensis]|uniref:Protein kinase domain-containing protein n=1 Tax=Hevea brasiliensis TaxID=3981 RepID=A0ABQ9KJV0_HEVBR|nr:hypothetical protein P3X46_031298 [Hevea brasiliensis]